MTNILPIESLETSSALHATGSSEDPSIASSLERAVLGQFDFPTLTQEEVEAAEQRAAALAAQTNLSSSSLTNTAAAAVPQPVPLYSSIAFG